MKRLWCKQFENKEYEKEWQELSTITKKPMKIGTVVQEEDTFAVYDGAHNWMGTFDKNGIITYNGTETEYMRTFCESAVEFARKEKRL